MGFAIDLDEERAKDFPGPYKIGAELVRRIPIGTIVMRHRRRLAAAETDDAAERASEYQRGDDELHYRNVAVVYHVAWRGGRRPTQAVQEEFGVSRATAGRWGQEARDREYLAATTSGKPNGAFGSKLPPSRLPRDLGGILELPEEERQAAVDQRIISELRREPTLSQEQREEQIQRYLAWVARRDQEGGEKK